MLRLDGPPCELQPVPLGAVVATCTLDDVVPMVGDKSWDDRADYARYLVVHEDGRLSLIDEDAMTSDDVSDQRSFGDFRPGRFAWLLEDIKRLLEPIPARGRQQLWDWDDGSPPCTPFTMAGRR
jgi:hypothetical protein